MEVDEIGRLLDLSGRVAVVTGAGSGLGLAVARRFAQAGARVVVHYRSSLSGASELVQELGPDRGVAVEADLTQPEEASSLIQAAVRDFGRLDVLVNNAGIYPLA